MRNYYKFWAQSWLTIDWSDPNNPIETGAFFHWELDEDDAARFAATLPVPVPGSFLGYQAADPYPKPTPMWFCISKLIYQDLLNNTGNLVYNHSVYQFTTPWKEGWPGPRLTNKNEPAKPSTHLNDRNTGEGFGGAPNPFLAWALEIYYTLLEKGYRSQADQVRAIINLYLGEQISAQNAQDRIVRIINSI